MSARNTRVRAELPRFTGELIPRLAGRLPKWTEDSFAGILLNVAAGRAANRFDMGGVNFTVDAACASSLAAVYQAVLELEDRPQRPRHHRRRRHRAGAVRLSLLQQDAGAVAARPLPHLRRLGRRHRHLRGRSRCWR